MKRLLAILLILCGPALAQFTSTAHHVYAGPTLPAHCSATAGDVFVINNTTPTQLYLCTATDTWTIGGGGTSVNVNGSSISSPNFNSTTPAAGTGYTNVAFQVSGSNVSAGIQRELTATFLLCAGGCYAGETTNWKWSAPFALAFTGCVIDAVTYPTGAAVTVDLLTGGTTTIFSGAVPTLAAGSSTFSTDTGMAANAAFTQGQYLIANVLTPGSAVAGQSVNLVCTATY